MVSRALMENDNRQYRTYHVKVGPTISTWNPSFARWVWLELCDKVVLIGRDGPRCGRAAAAAAIGFLKKQTKEACPFSFGPYCLSPTVCWQQTIWPKRL